MSRKSLSISWKESPGPAFIDFNKAVEGLEEESLAALVNIVSPDNDPLFPERGVPLLTEAQRGFILMEGERAHAASFAEALTKLFHQTVRPDSVLADLSLEFDGIREKTLVFRASFSSIDGERFGAPLSHNV